MDKDAKEKAGLVWVTVAMHPEMRDKLHQEAFKAGVRPATHYRNILAKSIGYPVEAHSPGKRAKKLAPKPPAPPQLSPPEPKRSACSVDPGVIADYKRRRWSKGAVAAILKVPYVEVERAW